MNSSNARVLEAQRILLRCSGNETSDLRRQLMLIYLADRECWQMLGQPLVPGPILATYQYGPMNATALKVLKGRSSVDFVFRELSKAEVRILQRVSVACQNLSTEDLHDRACQLPEWHAPLLVGGDVIPLERVLVAVGYSPDDAEAIALIHEELASARLRAASIESVSAVA